MRCAGRIVWGKETRFNCRVEAVFGALWWAARVKSLAAAVENRTRGCNSHAGREQPTALIPRANRSRVQRAPASPWSIARMPLLRGTAVARPSSCGEKARRRQPTAAADLAPANRTTPQHRWWRAPWLPGRRPLLPELERDSRTRCPRVRHRAQRGDRRRACSALVLPRHPEDQPARLGRKRRTTRPAAAPSAFALQQRPVPTAERLRADRKARPPLGRKQPAHRGK
jgi:hypothetical protein